MKKTVIVYGRLETPIEKRAVRELSVILFDRLGTYPTCVPYEDMPSSDTHHLIFVGTKENHPFIRACSKNRLSVPESYEIRVENGIAVIEGYDEAGVLYGVLDFENRYILPLSLTGTTAYFQNFFEKETLPDFSYTGVPSVKTRGLWTWGHVIYDYRAYFDNMLKLKMNSVIIWNDFAPVNCREIVEYAHECNIKVFFGFSWLWDTDCNRFDLSSLDGLSEEIFEKYQKEYAHSGADGIYFQTFTELNKEHIGGILIAEAATNFVNRTAALFYRAYPDIHLQFGLHAMSVRNRLEFIELVDRRIEIVWEDCGAFPFAYLPTRTENFDETLAFLSKIAHLRGEDDFFGVVTKGFVNLHWPSFVHAEGAQHIGVSSDTVREKRLAEKRKLWRYIQAGWMQNADKAYEMVRETVRLKRGNCSVHALVEDGMFEEKIMYCVALYAEMLFSCDDDLQKLSYEVALRDGISFA